MLVRISYGPKMGNIVESNIEEILTDHAWCEQKKAHRTNKFGLPKIQEKKNW
jgi:hypothetical protein